MHKISTTLRNLIAWLMQRDCAPSSEHRTTRDWADLPATHPARPEQCGC